MRHLHVRKDSLDGPSRVLQKVYGGDSESLPQSAVCSNNGHGASKSCYECRGILTSVILRFFLIGIESDGQAAPRRGAGYIKGTIRGGLRNLGAPRVVISILAGAGIKMRKRRNSPLKYLSRIESSINKGIRT